MIQYILKDATGKVLRRGTRESADLVPSVPGTTVEIVPLDYQPPTQPLYPPTFENTRKFAYPSVRDQLDMLWHAMDSGQIPKAQKFYNALKAVKDKYPKGGQ
jgi:hypothetical protein